MTIEPGAAWPVGLVVALSAWLYLIGGEIRVATEDQSLMLDDPHQRVTVEWVRVPRRALGAALLTVQAGWTPRARPLDAPAPPAA